MKSASGLWYGLLMAILLYLLGFGISVVLGEIEVTGFQFKPLDLLGSWVFFLLVALFEEILMRGYILGRRSRRSKIMAAVRTDKSILPSTKIYPTTPG